MQRAATPSLLLRAASLLGSARGAVHLEPALQAARSARSG